MADLQHILIAANPKSGAVSRQQTIAGLRQALMADGYAVDVCESLDAVQKLANQLHGDRKLRAVVSAGGDGTAAALANRIAADVPLLVFPLGTENLLAKHLGLTSDIASVRDRIRGGKSLALDVGLANGKVFLVMASCGFDAAVVECMHASRKGHINRWSYAKPILNAMRNYHFPLLEIATDGNTEPIGSPGLTSAAWLFAFNLPRYAANLQFCPQANPLDGLLDVCTFKNPGILKAFAYLANLWCMRHQQHADFSHTLCNHLTVKCSSSVPVHYQLDGDPGGVLPLELGVLPGRLKLIV
jgi:diacylglycerol kinase (ATP)